MLSYTMPIRQCLSYTFYAVGGGCRTDPPGCTTIMCFPVTSAFPDTIPLSKAETANPAPVDRKFYRVATRRVEANAAFEG